MRIENTTTEILSMGKNFILYAILSPVVAFGALYLVDFVKKSFISGSRVRQWLALTLVVFTLYMVILGL